MRQVNVKHMFFATVVIVFGLGVAGCIAPLPASEGASAPEAPTGADAVMFEGIMWRLVTFADATGATVDALPETEITALFQDGEVGGSAGCNQYFGSYNVDGNALSVTLGGSTMMACMPPVAEQEAQYLANLGAAATFAVEGTALHITDAEQQVVLTYEAYEPAPLLNTNWRLLRYNNGRGGLTTDLTSELITAVFSPEGNVSGFAGCNNYSATFSVDGDKIEIGPARSTQKACSEPEGVMETESAYLAALQTAVTFEREGRELTLRNAEGTPAVVYRVDDRVASSLVGPNWHLLQYNNGKGGLVSDLTSELITASFGEDGNMGGFAGCNDYSASYTTDGDLIQIGPAMSTMKACEEPQGVMETESAYLAALTTATSFELQGDELTLRNEAGTIAAKYRAETP